MNTRWLRLLWLLPYALVCWVVFQWPPAPAGTVFTVRPVEAHVQLAASLMQSGDTLQLVPDGRPHLWTRAMSLRSGLTNVTLDFGGAVITDHDSGIQGDIIMHGDAAITAPPIEEIEFKDAPIQTPGH